MAVDYCNTSIRGARDLVNSKWSCDGLDVDDPFFEEDGGVCGILKDAIAAQKELGVPKKITKGVERAFKTCCSKPSSGDEAFECCNCSRETKKDVIILFKSPDRNGNCPNFDMTAIDENEVSFPKSEIDSEELEKLEELVHGGLR